MDVLPAASFVLKLTFGGLCAWADSQSQGGERGQASPCPLEAHSPELGPRKASLTASCQVLFQRTQPNWGPAFVSCVLWLEGARSGYCFLPLPSQT